MAFLRHPNTGEIIPLHSHHTIGRREESVDTLINRDDVSKIHAVISWNGNYWTLRCLSTNGTWLNNTRLERDVATKLTAGQSINFSGPNTETWLIEDIAPPKDLLIPLDNSENIITLDNYHLLPNEDEAVASCYFCSKTEAWLLDSHKHSANASPQILEHDALINVGYTEWRVFLAEKFNPTKRANTLKNTVSDYRWHFDVSLDEESVKISLKQADRTVHLGERSHYQLLLQLARHKAEHMDQGLTEEAAGWVTKNLLEKELGLSESHLNIQLHRSCKQLAEHFSFTVDQPDSIQRRRGQLKLTSRDFIVKKGGEITHQICCK